ncbi:DnaJ protein ERDJ3A [Camellia lanceoleosa]|uniref:DnaJ protein ERDJ3A n=1 Tax=Camellia lanceoleosa TaxID=1840588 RepID=A0ACC0HRI8_9ERIC|nr:DnaJ protein ERDJ3A [Camellia lanceoleosa]
MRSKTPQPQQEAYDILLDEAKRKNYDLYGDEKGNPGFDAGNAGDDGRYTYFTSGGPGHGGFSFRHDEWQNMGGHGSSKSFSFSLEAKVVRVVRAPLVLV